MSDNVGYLPSSDPNAVPIAADNIAGTRFQRMKLTIGADGVNDGDVATANPLPVAAAAYETRTAVSGALTYVGKAAPGASPSAAVWQIARLDETTAEIALKYADGVASFSKVWNSRASYAY